MNTRKKLVCLFAFVATAAMATAQEIEIEQDVEIGQETAVASSKHSVPTNSFWANWFLQANVGYDHGTRSDSESPLLWHRDNLTFSIGLGKWFTPGIALRAKFGGFNKYWTLEEHALLNVTNMVMGYNEQRIWNVIPFFGANLGRNMQCNTYKMGLSVGLLNTIRLSSKFAVNIEASYSGYEPKNHNRVLRMEVGFTYRLGNHTWRAITDNDAQHALMQSEIDAINAQLEDLQRENERLNKELEKARK